MIGKRVHYGESGSWIKPRQYGQYWDSTIWYACSPNGLLANLGNHKVTEHEDGTITVSPSILVTGCNENGQSIQWHGYLERGTWREC